MRGEELENMIGLYFSFQIRSSTFYTWWIQVEKSQHFCSVQHQISGLHYVVYLGSLKKITSHKKCNTFFDNFSVCQKISTQHCIGKKKFQKPSDFGLQFLYNGLQNIIFFFRKGIQLFWKTTMYLFLAFSCYFTWHIEFELKKLKIKTKICNKRLHTFFKSKISIFWRK